MSFRDWTFKFTHKITPKVILLSASELFPRSVMLLRVFSFLNCLPEACVAIKNITSTLKITFPSSPDILVRLSAVECLAYQTQTTRHVADRNVDKSPVKYEILTVFSTMPIRHDGQMIIFHSNAYFQSLPQFPCLSNFSSYRKIKFAFSVRTTMDHIDR